MPANINDTPARKKQNDDYIADPTAPAGKPYSRKQSEANTAHKGRTRLYHKTQCPNNGQVFEGFEVDDALADGWVDEPYVHPNAPDHAPMHDQEESPVSQDDEMKTLWAEVDRLDIKPRPHPATGKAKLRKAIADA